MVVEIKINVPDDVYEELEAIQDSYRERTGEEVSISEILLSCLAFCRTMAIIERLAEGLVTEAGS